MLYWIIVQCSAGSNFNTQVHFAESISITQRVHMHRQLCEAVSFGFEKACIKIDMLVCNI